MLEENGLNCSQSSIMKMAALSCEFNKYKRGLFLSEHRRCYNEIITYCNKLVYEGKLEPKRGSFYAAEYNELRGLLPVMGFRQVTTAKHMKKFYYSTAKKMALRREEYWGLSRLLRAKVF